MKSVLFPGRIIYLISLTVGVSLSPAAFGTYAESIVSFTPGDPYAPEAPIENILGPPDIGDVWTDVLGSIGHFGEVVVDLGNAGVVDVEGPDLVFWYGGWQAGDGEFTEGFRLDASTNSVDFVFVTEVPRGPDISSPPPPVPLTPITVDLAESGLIFARYLKITDTGTDADACGLELNAIEVIPEPSTLLLIGYGGLALLRRRKI